jgi:hypothetical protein
MYGQGKERTRGWVEARLEELRIGDVEGVILGLMELKPKREEVKEEVEQALSYFTNQGMRMRYPIYREKGYPIGSGPVESACKNLGCLA